MGGLIAPRAPYRPAQYKNVCKEAPMSCDGDLYLRVLRDGASYRLPRDRESWPEGELLYQYRHLWLLFYRECTAFKHDLGCFYRRSYLPTRRFYSDRDELRAVGIEPDLVNLQSTVTLGDLCNLHYYRLDFDPSPTPPVALARYFDDLHRFCRRWGLDRLYPVGTAWRARRECDPAIRDGIFANSHPDGPAEVHLWCESQASGFGFFGLATPWSGFLPSIGDPHYYVLDGADGDQFIVRDATGDPTVRLPSTEDTWHPMRESRKTARARILKRVSEQLDRELDRVQARGEEAGLITVRNAPALMRDAAFAFMHLALHMTYPNIERRTEQEAGKSPPWKDISDAVYDRAPLLGLCLTQPATGNKSLLA